MASASTLPTVEPSIVIVAQTDGRSIGSATNFLVGGGASTSSIDRVSPSAVLNNDSITNANGPKWYLADHIGYPDQTYETTARNQLPSLPIYLPSPTTAGAQITMGSSLDPLQTSVMVSSAGQQVDPPSDDNVIVVTAPDRKSSVDPLSAINAESFEIAQDIDQALVAPVANAYKEGLPKPIRSGLRNFISNLGEPVVFLNYLLQLKPGKALETLGRFAINTTIGIGGLVDVAKEKPFYLPNRFNGFANTLGFYGVKPGAYLYLPLAGSTTVRDLIGDSLDLLVLPTAVGKPFTQIEVTAPIGVLRALDRRIQRDDEITQNQEESDDPYVSARDQYLKSRQIEIDILKGRIPDPLSRKKAAAPAKETYNARQFKYETAELWYLPSKNYSDLGSNNARN